MGGGERVPSYHAASIGPLIFAALRFCLALSTLHTSTADRGHKTLYIPGLCACACSCAARPWFDGAPLCLPSPSPLAACTASSCGLWRAHTPSPTLLFLALSLSLSPPASSSPPPRNRDHGKKPSEIIKNATRDRARATRRVSYFSRPPTRGLSRVLLEQDDAPLLSLMRSVSLSFFFPFFLFRNEKSELKSRLKSNIRGEGERGIVPGNNNVTSTRVSFFAVQLFHLWK